MLKSYLKPMALAVLVATGVSLSSVTAAPVTYSAGDLLMGFRKTGETESYIINLGSASSFRDATSSLSNFRDIGGDLIALFGSGWATDPGVSWSIATVISSTLDDDPSRTIYLSLGGNGSTSQSTANAVFGSSTNRNGAVNQINGFQSSVSILEGTEDSGGYGALQANAATNSWFSASHVQDGSDWTAGFNTESTFTNGVAGTSLDLYRFGGVNALSTSGLTGTYEGTFTIDSNGQISFSTVPEPSTYVLVALAGAFVMIMRRRMTVAQVNA